MTDNTLLDTIISVQEAVMLFLQQSPSIHRTPPSIDTVEIRHNRIGGLYRFWNIIESLTNDWQAHRMHVTILDYTISS